MMNCSRFADLVFLGKEDGTGIGAMYFIGGLDSIYFSIFKELDCNETRSSVFNMQEQKCMVKSHYSEFMNHMNACKVS